MPQVDYVDITALAQVVRDTAGNNIPVSVADAWQFHNAVVF